MFGRYSAVRAIQERAKLNADVFTAIKDSMAGDPELVLESVQVENIDFSSQYVQSIEQRMQAEIEVQRIQQQFQQQEVQAKITVVNAQARPTRRSRPQRRTRRRSSCAARPRPPPSRRAATP